jgi:hypothetical protein
MRRRCHDSLNRQLVRPIGQVGSRKFPHRVHRPKLRVHARGGHRRDSYNLPTCTLRRHPPQPCGATNRDRAGASPQQPAQADNQGRNPDASAREAFYPADTTRSGRLVGAQNVRTCSNSVSISRKLWPTTSAVRITRPSRPRSRNVSRSSLVGPDPIADLVHPRHGTALARSDADPPVLGPIAAIRGSHHPHIGRHTQAHTGT